MLCILHMCSSSVGLRDRILLDKNEGYELQSKWPAELSVVLPHFWPRISEAKSNRFPCRGNWHFRHSTSFQTKLSSSPGLIHLETQLDPNLKVIHEQRDLTCGVEESFH